MQDTQPQNNRPDGVEEIQSVDFSPPPARIKEKRWRPRWYHFVILLAAASVFYTSWFVLTARSVFIDVTPATANIEIDGGLAVQVGPRYLIRPGQYQVSFSEYGYDDLQATLGVSEATAQTHEYQLSPKEGYLNLTVDAEPMPGNSVDMLARIKIDGVDVGEAPLEQFPVEPGTHNLVIESERYLDVSQEIEIVGRLEEQELSVELQPAWAELSIVGARNGADVLLDGEVVGQVPLQFAQMQGNYVLTVRESGYKAWQQDLVLTAGNDQRIDVPVLEAADGLVFIRSEPAGANVTVNDDFMGQTPLELTLPPGEDYRIRLFRTGYDVAEREITTSSGESTDLTVALDAITSPVRLIAQPADAEIYVDGEYRGRVDEQQNQQIELMAAAQRIEIWRDGYVPYESEFVARPGIDQEIRATLVTEEAARLAAIEPEITSPGGQTLQLFYPYAYTMGASRREPGRRANEALRDVVLTRDFYMSENLVTNAQFKQFRSEHASGVLQGQTLDNASQPVVQISWDDAALYCNWLSQQAGLDPFYIVEEGNVTGFNAGSTGYRMPTEAEWEWAARTEGESDVTHRFPWGNSWPPSNNEGNFADESTQSFLAQFIRGYNDGHAVTSNTGQFPPNARGLYDMAGNVSEWVHDIYGAVSGLNTAAETDPMGPEAGRYHTVKGSSWRHGSVVELRASYRDFSEEPRNDVGFRVARFLEEAP